MMAEGVGERQAREENAWEILEYVRVISTASSLAPRQGEEVRKIER